MLPRDLLARSLALSLPDRRCDRKQAHRLLLVENATNSIIGPPRETAFGNLRNVQLLFQVVDGGGAATIFTLSTDNGTDDFTLAGVTKGPRG